MAVSKPRFTTRFRFTASARLDAPAARQMEAVASLDRLRTLLPRDIDPESHPTLLFVAGNLAVGGVSNLNHDAMTLEDTIRTHRAFEWQLVDVEHLRSDIKGFIVKAGLSELGTDRLITPEEARAAGKPVNVAIVVALWKVADADLCAFIQQMDAPASPDKGKLSFSFEVGFDDYDIGVLPAGATNLSLASQIVTPDSPDFNRFDRLLCVNGGKGTFGKDRVVRILMGNIVPLGAGIVTAPAAAVKGLTAITTSPHATETDAAQKADAGLYKYSSTQCTLSAADAAPFLAYAAAIPDEHIATDPDDPTIGRETESHGTICYGLTTADPTAVQACFAGFGPITVTMGKVAAFTGGDRTHDVLYVEMDSPDMHRAHALVKTATEVQSKWPSYTSHLTLAYCKPGMARGYVGDTRFEGKTLTFDSITFSPHTGDRVEIALAAKPSPYTDQIGQVPVQPSATPDTSMAQSDSDGVYIDDLAMSSKTVQIAAEFSGLKDSLVSQVREGLAIVASSRQIKLSQGWQERLASLQTAEAGKEGNAPLVNGVNITLSDGRKLTNVKVFDGSTLELDKELSMSGVVITDMTPGVAPQADSPEVEHPHKALVYPTTSPEQQARDAANETMRKAGQNAAYTDASLEEGFALTEDEVVAASKEAKKPYGDVQYADPGYQKDGKKRYPIDTPEHIRAAWSYINKPKNCGEYTPEQCSHIKSKIVSAWKAKIDKAGPDGAKASLNEVETSLRLDEINRIFSLSAERLNAFSSLLFSASTNTSSASVSPSNPTTSPMNLSELKQSLASVKTVEDLPTAVANVQLFADAIAKASETLAAERKTAQESAQTAQAALDEIKTQMAALKKTNDEIVAAQASKAAEAAFNDRMNAVEAAFDLDDEVRAEVVPEITACTTDESFAKWLASAKKKMKGFIKKKADDKAKADDGDGDEAAAKAAAKLALASAAANVVDSPVNHDFTATATLADQMKATFAANISVGGVKVKDLTKSKK